MENNNQQQKEMKTVNGFLMPKMNIHQMKNGRIVSNGTIATKVGDNVKYTNIAIFDKIINESIQKSLGVTAEDIKNGNFKTGEQKLDLKQENNKSLEQLKGLRAVTGNLVSREYEGKTFTKLQVTQAKDFAKYQKKEQVQQKEASRPVAKKPTQARKHKEQGMSL